MSAGARSEWALWKVPPEHPTAYVVDVDTVTDTVTGLVWQRSASGPIRFLEDAQASCLDLDLDGQTDWRMPNLKELLSIVDSTLDRPYIHPAAFPDLPPGFFWTSTPFAGRGGAPRPSAWQVDFFAGEMRFEGDATYVRCVRSGATRSEPHYTTTEGTVVDAYTGLTWQRQLPEASVTWSQAEERCASLTLEGQSGWRLPTRKELETIVDHRVPIPGPTIDQKLFPGPISGGLWSSSLAKCPQPYRCVWTVNFNAGATHLSKTLAFTPSDTKQARCVR